ncbi:MAG TPA: GntR family transcriptional regulator [Longimicrobiales bacterium]|nr:GntR family transcriptional regulator [Longimicrobiales bacterium]
MAARKTRPEPKSGAPANRLGAALNGDRITAVYQKLRELIVSGRLAPGTRITEGDVVERFGISRTPVRSALQRLQQEGFIQATTLGRQARLVVSPLTQEDLDELFGLVGEIEGFTARRAAVLPAEARAAVARTLREKNDALARLAETPTPDPDRFFDLDFAFHGAYVQAGGGPRVLALHDGIAAQAERYARVYVSALTNRIDDSVREHATIISGIESGDPDAAQRAVQVNWRNAAERLGTVIAKIGERGIW